MAAFRDLEILVAKIQKYLAPSAKVQHNVKLDGRISGTKRQIDVLVEQMIGQYKMVIVIDSKDHSTPVDVIGVGAFVSLVKDVGANKGVLVSPLGFTEAAKTMALKLEVELYSPVDTDPHKWQVKPTVPFIVEFKRCGFSFTLKTSAGGPLGLSEDFPTVSNIFDKDGRNLGTPMKAATNRWFDGLYHPDPNEQSGLPVFDACPIFMDNGFGTQIQIALSVSLKIMPEFFFGQLPITDIKGFRDEVSGYVITRGFTTGNFDPIEVRKNWRQIASRTCLIRR